MHYGRNCLRFVTFIIFIANTKQFSDDQQIYFKHDINNKEYKKLFCDDNPLCDKWSNSCENYIKSNRNDDTHEYCNRLLETCYKSDKCCTGKTGCCNGRCKNIHKQNVGTNFINLIVILFLAFTSFHFHYNLNNKSMT